MLKLLTRLYIFSFACEVQVHQREPCNSQEAMSCYLKAEGLMKTAGVSMHIREAFCQAPARELCTFCLMMQNLIVDGECCFCD
jgi:hypothetical protein